MPEQLDLEDTIVHLYDLQHEELRRLAWEALLIADGPDSTFSLESPNKYSKFDVIRWLEPGTPGFLITGKNGWQA